MLSYVECKTGDKPPSNAVEAGFDDGPSYHARGLVEGLTVPGKVCVRSENDLHLVEACIPYGSAEHLVHSFEVLTVDDPSALTYERCKTGDRPPDNAVQGGFNGGPTYHARGEVGGKIIPGKADVEVARDDFYLKGAYIPYGSSEHRIHDFQVLVMADKIEHVEFHCDRGKLLATNPKVFAVQEVSNNSSQPQSKELSYSETVSSTSSFTHQWGISVSRSAQFSAKLPTVAEGKITTTTTGSVSLTWGETETFEKTVSGKHPVVAAPFTKVICEVVANEATMDVPYTMYFKSGKTSGGRWKGVSTWDVKTSFKEEKLNPSS
ncbi:PREDICTED: natterin-4-like [Acropora digitifera]|uniref:natterin-4-like n=1 Tax=Acropora digitifera TaxID=70779 RepID=UPI00077AABEE|nr:PREDICTED: natterin-4-like [Acropora digitifera]